MLADQAAAQGSMRLLPGSAFIIHEYQASLQGKPSHGLAIYAFNHFSGKFESAWVDSFHMSTNMMFSQGPARSSGFALLGSYPDPGGGPDWGWRTEIEILDTEHVILSAYNVKPSGDEAKALEMDYFRKTAGLFAPRV